jgi:hypothetical protein
MAKYPSQGCVLQLTIANTYTTIAQLTTINVPDPEVEIDETTDLTVTHGKTFDTTGLVDAGEFGGSGFFDPAAATHTALTAYIKAPVANSLTLWKATYSDAAPTSWTWSGIVKKFKPTIEIGQFMKFDFSGKVSGVVTGW